MEINVTTPDIADYFDVQIDELFKIDMSNYKNKASRLVIKYDMSGKTADKTDICNYARLNIYRSDALAKKAEELFRTRKYKKSVGNRPSHY